MSRPPVRFPFGRAALLAAALLASGLLISACGGPAAQRSEPKPDAEVANEPPGRPAGAAAQGRAGEAAQAPMPDAAPDAANVRAPGAGAPPRPSPLPALNEYAEHCLRVEPPAEAAAAGPFVADCCAQLLETLRATVGALRLPAAAVGESLSDAEIAVRHLGAGVSAPAAADEAAGRAARAATALAVLARSVAAADAADGGATADAAALDALAAAAAVVDGGRPLGEQRDVLAAFFASADAVVRPLARAGGL